MSCLDLRTRKPKHLMGLSTVGLRGSVLLLALGFSFVAKAELNPYHLGTRLRPIHPEQMEDIVSGISPLQSIREALHSPILKDEAPRRIELLSETALDFVIAVGLKRRYLISVLLINQALEMTYGTPTADGLSREKDSIIPATQVFERAAYLEGSLQVALRYGEQLEAKDADLIHLPYEEAALFLSYQNHEVLRTLKDPKLRLSFAEAALRHWTYFTSETDMNPDAGMGTRIVKARRLLEKIAAANAQNFSIRADEVQVFLEGICHEAREKFSSLLDKFRQDYARAIGLVGRADIAFHFTDLAAAYGRDLNHYEDPDLGSRVFSSGNFEEEFRRPTPHAFRYFQELLLVEKAVQSWNELQALKLRFPRWAQYASNDFCEEISLDVLKRDESWIISIPGPLKHFQNRFAIAKDKAIAASTRFEEGLRKYNPESDYFRKYPASEFFMSLKNLHLLWGSENFGSEMKGYMEKAIKHPSQLVRFQEAQKKMRSDYYVNYKSKFHQLELKVGRQLRFEEGDSLLREQLEKEIAALNGGIDLFQDLEESGEKFRASVAKLPIPDSVQPVGPMSLKSLQGSLCGAEAWWTRLSSEEREKHLMKLDELLKELEERASQEKNAFRPFTAARKASSRLMEVGHQLEIAAIRGILLDRHYEELKRMIGLAKTYQLSLRAISIWRRRKGGLYDEKLQIKSSSELQLQLSLQSLNEIAGNGGIPFSALLPNSPEADFAPYLSEN